jgi:hypothetical protein
VGLVVTGNEKVGIAAAHMMFVSGGSGVHMAFLLEKAGQHAGVGVWVLPQAQTHGNGNNTGYSSRRDWSMYQEEAWRWWSLIKGAVLVVALAPWWMVASQQSEQWRCGCALYLLSQKLILKLCMVVAVLS